MDGREVLRRLRRSHIWTPTILLTQVGEASERALALEEGADDYLNKPFDPHELLARIRAVLRRAGESAPKATVVKAADVTLDRETRIVTVGERSVDLTPSEFDLLAAMMSAPGRVFSRLDLLDIIQGVRYEGYERTIDTHVKNLRGKIEANPREPRYIETLYAVGYRFAKK
jgi:DNA-binding response OmpR family regulator